MSAFSARPSLTLIKGDCLQRLQELPAGSVQTVVTSPPYFGLRSYLPDGHPDKDLEVGTEPTPDMFVSTMVAVFREVKRVLREDGTVWLNLGDSYNAAGRKTHGVRDGVKQGSNRASATGADECRPNDPTLKEKDLIGIPWRVALALQADGWYLRSDIIWQKPNPMPESVRDRPTRSHEYLFLLSKSPRYFYDAEAVKEPCVSGPADLKKMREQKERLGGKTLDSTDPLYAGNVRSNIGKKRGVGDGVKRNRRSVWTIATRPFKGAHFATMPETLVEPCILAGTSEMGACAECGAPWKRVVNGVGWDPSCKCEAGAPVPCVVMDPFSGAATVGLSALRHGRSYVGVELNPAYLEMSRKRLEAVLPSETDEGTESAQVAV